MILRFATPIACVSLVNVAMSVTDTFMVSSLGGDALTAMAVGSDVYSRVFYFSRV